MPSTFKRTVSAAVRAMGLASAPFMVGAQQSGAPQGSVTTQPQAVDSSQFSDSDLQKFVAASQKVAVISQDYAPKLQQAEDPTEQQKVLEEADQKMISAVEKEGISVDQFLMINQAAQQDPALAQRIQGVAQ